MPIRSRGMFAALALVVLAAVPAMAQTRPGVGYDPQARGPTEVELTDMQALNDTGLWVTYFQAELPGFSPDHRVVICDPAKPPGDSQGIEPFWGIPYYTHNNFQPSFVSPQLPAALACPGN